MTKRYRLISPSGFEIYILGDDIIDREIYIYQNIGVSHKKLVAIVPKEFLIIVESETTEI